MDDNQIWGQGEVDNFIPPDEVVERVLEMPEVAMDYPDVYDEAMRIKREKEDLATESTENTEKK